MSTSLSVVGVHNSSHNISRERQKQRAADLQVQAGLVEKMIPRFQDEHESQFYREVVESYRAVARDILRRLWSGESGQDIAEYAVMLAVILVIVVGTIRLIGSNSNTVFSHAASSIQ